MENIDIKIETPYFEVYDACLRNDNIDQNVEAPVVERFQENNSEVKNEKSEVAKCSASSQGEDIFNLTDEKCVQRKNKFHIGRSL